MGEIQEQDLSPKRPARGGFLLFLVCWASFAHSSRAEETAAQPPVDLIGAETELSLGVMDFEKGLYERAQERLAKARQAGPAADYYRGLSLLALRRAKEALRAFEAVRKQPGAPGEAELDAGVAQLSAGDSAAAAETLARYAGSHPEDPYGHYFLGVALFRRKRYRESLAQFEQATTDSRLAPYLNFYKGLTEVAEGGPGSRSYFDRFREEVRSGASAEAAERLAYLPSRPGPASTLPGSMSNLGRPVDPNAAVDRHWNLALLNAYEYDSNVALAPGIIPLGLGAIGRKPDSRYFLASFGDYRMIQQEKLVFGVIGSTYDSFQIRLSQYNIQDYMLGTYLNAALTDRIIGGVRYEYHETLLAGRQFLHDQRFTPNFTLREGTFGHTTAYYEFEPADVTGFALIPAQNRSGNANSVGITQAVYLYEGAGRLFLGYRYDNARTLGTDFDRSTDQLDARLEIPLPWKTVFNIEARYFWDDYKHPNSLDFEHRARRDERIEARAGFQKFFTAHISGRLDYLYIDNASNVRNLFGASFYSYNRNVLSAVLIYDF